jgi:hypothetical protein
MSAPTIVFDPTAPSQNEPQALAGTVTGLSGATVGFIDNGGLAIAKS